MPESISVGSVDGYCQSALVDPFAVPLISKPEDGLVHFEAVIAVGFAPLLRLFSHMTYGRDARGSNIRTKSDMDLGWALDQKSQGSEGIRRGRHQLSFGHGLLKLSYLPDTPRPKRATAVFALWSSSWSAS